MIGPLPGEVWIQTSDGKFEASWGPSTISGEGVGHPFIVTSLTVSRIYYAAAGNEGTKTSWIVIDSGWEWLEHFERLWPRVPSWEELREAGIGREDA
jgi:hypothetical protein